MYGFRNRKVIKEMELRRVLVQITMENQWIFQRKKCISRVNIIISMGEIWDTLAKPSMKKQPENFLNKIEIHLKYMKEYGIVLAEAKVVKDKLL